MPFLFSRKNVGPVHSLTTQVSICESNKQTVLTSNTWGRQSTAAKLLHLTLWPGSNPCRGGKAREKNKSCGHLCHGEMKPSTASSLHLPCSNAEGGLVWLCLHSPQVPGCELPSPSPRATQAPGMAPGCGARSGWGSFQPFLGYVFSLHPRSTSLPHDRGVKHKQGRHANTPAPRSAAFPTERGH